MDESLSGHYRQLRSFIRILLILDAADRANLTPIAAVTLHGIAYLSNVLAPIWNLIPYEGTVYKRGSTPYYPLLQQDVDAMVGHGLVDVVELDYKRDPDGRWRFSGSFELNRALAHDAVEYAVGMTELSEVSSFLRELTLALSAFNPNSLADIAAHDANYANIRASSDNVVDFAQWERRNYGAAAAHLFERLIPGPLRASRGEQLNLYVRHLNRLLSHARTS